MKVVNNLNRKKGTGKEGSKIEKKVKRQQKVLKVKEKSSSYTIVCAEDLASHLKQLTVLHDDFDGECRNQSKLISEECLWVQCNEYEQMYDISCQNVSKNNTP